MLPERGVCDVPVAALKKEILAIAREAHMAMAWATVRTGGVRLALITWSIGTRPAGMAHKLAPRGRQTSGIGFGQRL